MSCPDISDIILYSFLLFITGGEDMRLFVAVKFIREMEKALTDIQSEMKENGISGNYTDAKNLHLTLAFIGEYNSPERVMEALSQVKFEPFRLSLEERIGNFRDILWVGVKKDTRLMSLDANVRKALAGYHIPFDPRPFRPHITLVRKAVSHNALCKTDRVFMTVEKFSLMHSHRENGKLIYTEIGNIKAK